MTPEDKAEKWYKDTHSGTDWVLMQNLGEGYNAESDAKHALKQAYLSGYAEYEKELKEEYDEASRLGREFLIKAGQLKE